AAGRPQQIRVQRPLGMGLDEKAIEAVKMWKFEPARKDGQPVPVMINVEVNFRLYDLSPHPDSAGQPPRFPGIDTSKYPLVVRLNAISFSGSGAARTAGYQAAITDAGQERQVTISCILASSHCLVLADGTYPARWEENMKSLEILGLSWGGHGEWKKTEYTVKLEEPAAPGGVTQPTAGAAAADSQNPVVSGGIGNSTPPPKTSVPQQATAPIRVVAASVTESVPTDCSAVPSSSQSVFLTTAAKLWLSFQYIGGYKGGVGRVEWISPEGAVYHFSPFIPATT